jgi:flavin-binding protein dodecin
MTNHRTYKKIEIVGTSPSSIENAIKNAISECSVTLKNMDWFEVIDTRGHIVDDKVGHFQVTLKIGFRVEAS